MAACFSVLAWKFPWTEEPGGLQFMGSQRVRHSGVTEHTHMVIKMSDFCMRCSFKKLLGIRTILKDQQSFISF